MVKILEDVAERLVGHEILATPLILLFPGQAKDSSDPRPAPINYERFLETQRTEAFGTMPRCPVMSCMGLLLFLQLNCRAALDLGKVFERAREKDQLVIDKLTNLLSVHFDESKIPPGTPCVQEMKNLTLSHMIGGYVHGRIDMPKTEQDFFSCRDEHPEAVEEIIRLWFPPAEETKPLEQEPSLEVAEDSSPTTNTSENETAAALVEATEEEPLVRQGEEELNAVEERAVVPEEVETAVESAVDDLPEEVTLDSIECVSAEAAVVVIKDDLHSDVVAEQVLEVAQDVEE